MDSFTRSLKRSVDAALGKTSPWGKINPLVVIGLTEALLDLHLSEDQMYAAVRSYVRQLAAQVHPDRSPTNVTATRQLEIIEALNILDDRAAFSYALKEFRELKGEDRKELAILRNALSNARTKLEGFDARELKLAQETREFEGHRRRFEVDEETRKNRVVYLEETVENFKGETRDLRASRSRWKKRYEGINEYLTLLSSGDQTRGGGVHVPEARWAVLFSLILAGVGEKRVLPVDKKGDWTSDFTRSVQDLRIPVGTLLEVQEQWPQLVAKFGQTDFTDFGRVYKPWLSAYKLSGGKPELLFGTMRAISGGFVLGSISPDRLKIGRQNLTHNFNIDQLFENLSPNLVQGGILVSRTVKNVKGERSSPKKLTITQSRHLIVAAG